MSVGSVENLLFCDSNRVSPEEFGSVIDRLRHRNGKTGPSPLRLLKVAELFLGREDGFIELDEAEAIFSLEGKEKPRKYAADAISDLDGAFQKNGERIEIVTVELRDRDGWHTYYYLSLID